MKAWKCVQFGSFWCLTPTDRLLICLRLRSSSINFLMCVSCTLLCGKPFLHTTLLICNENKWNSTVDFNILTQFSTQCLMWLEQSNCSFPVRFAWVDNWIFHCICLTSYWSIFSSVVAINMYLKVKQWFHHCFVIKLFSYLWKPHAGSVELLLSWLAVNLIDGAHVIHWICTSEHHLFYIVHAIVLDQDRNRKVVEILWILFMQESKLTSLT